MLAPWMYAAVVSAPAISLPITSPRTTEWGSGEPSSVLEARKAPRRSFFTGVVEGGAFWRAVISLLASCGGGVKVRFWVGGLVSVVLWGWAKTYI